MAPFALKVNPTFVCVYAIPLFLIGCEKALETITVRKDVHAVAFFLIIGVIANKLIARNNTSELSSPAGL